MSSPLSPVEPFTLLDVQLRHQISFAPQAAHNTVVYILAGSVLVRADGNSEKVQGRQALALHSGEERITFETPHPAHFLVLSGAEIREPVVVEGPFIMNEPAQIADAATRYRMGAMGPLAPLPRS